MGSMLVMVKMVMKVIFPKKLVTVLSFASLFCLSKLSNDQRMQLHKIKTYLMDMIRGPIPDILSSLLNKLQDITTLFSMYISFSSLQSRSTINYYDKTGLP